MAKKGPETVFDPQSRCSQQNFAALLGINQSQVSRAISRGILKRTDTFKSWLRAYVRHLSEQAAGRRGAGALDLVQERARLSKLQADRIAMELKVKRREVLHVDAMVLGISSIFFNVKTHLLGLPSKVKHVLAHLAPADIEQIRSEIYRCLTELSQMQLPKDVRGKIVDIEAELWGDIGADPTGKGGDDGGSRTDDDGGGRDLSQSPRAGHEGGKAKTSKARVSASRSQRGAKAHAKRRGARKHAGDREDQAPGEAPGTDPAGAGEQSR